MRVSSLRTSRAATPAAQQRKPAASSAGLTPEIQGSRMATVLDRRKQADRQRAFQAISGQQPPSAIQLVIEQSPQQKVQRQRVEQLNRVSLQRQAGVQRQGREDEQALQRKPVPGMLTRTTHLIEMVNRSLLYGVQQQRVYPDDVLVLEDSDRVWSRRGADGERRREYHRNQSTTDYKYYRVLKHNNTDVSDKLLYARATMFRFSEDQDLEQAVADAESNNLLRDMLLDIDELYAGNIRLGRHTHRLLAGLGDIIDSAPDNAGIDKAAFNQAYDAASGEIENRHIARALAGRRRARDERYRAVPRQAKIEILLERAMGNRTQILAALANIELQAVAFGRGAMQEQGTAEEEGHIDLWKDVLAIGDRAYDLRTEGTDEAMQRISTLSASAKEKFNTLYGYFGNTWDGFGIVAASVESLAAITALSAVIASVGMAIGLIAFGSGLFFAIRTGQREKALAETQARLEQQAFSEDLIDIADYARKQKKKKKKRQRIVAGGGLAVAVMAGIGLAGGPLAIVMAVLGAAVGIGFILYKWYRKTRGKRKAMRAMIDAAIDRDDADSLGALQKLGISDDAIDAAGDNAGARRALESSVEQKLKDRRVDTANRLVGYLNRGKPSEKVGAEAILINLGVDPVKMREVYAHDKAVSKVASKLGSW